MLDFSAVARLLRQNLIEHSVSLDPASYEQAVGLRAATATAEKEMAVQAIVFLYHHLKHWENWIGAASLLAYSLPHVAADDTRVKELLADASNLAEKVKDPALERISRYASLVESIDDWFAKDLTGLAPRAWYWLSVVRLTGAKSALEYGCGGGANVLQLAKIAPDLDWWGYDISEKQVEANRAQAARLGLHNARFCHEHPASPVDVVAVLDTLEHTVHPQELLRSAERFLTPSAGLVVVSTPCGSWSQHTDNEKNVGPGQHIAVERVGTLAAKLAPRGAVLDVQILPGFYREGNSTVVATYRPGPPGSGHTFAPMKRMRGLDKADGLLGVMVTTVLAPTEPLVAPAPAPAPELPLAGLKIYYVYPGPSWWGERLSPRILDEDTGKAIAGGETYMLECAFGCAAAGAQVEVASNVFRAGRHRGVTFTPLHFDLQTANAVLSVLNPTALLYAPQTAARIFLQQCNHLWFGFDWMSGCDAVMAASIPHASWLARQGIWQGPYEIAHNGCPFHLYPDPPIELAKRPPVVGYWSSPDRGLHHLLRAWPHVLARRLEARLHVYYEIDRIFEMKHTRARVENWGHMPGMEARLDDLEDAVRGAKGMPSIQFRGMVSRKQIVREQAQTRILCYPADVVGFTEGFSQAIADGMAAGCIVLTRPVDAIPHLHGAGVEWITGDPGSPDFPRELAEQIDVQWERRPPEAARATAARWSWQNTHMEVVRVIERVLARKNGRPIPEPAFPL